MRLHATLPILGVVAASLLPGDARADDANVLYGQAQRRIQRASGGVPAIERAVAGTPKVSRTPTQRIADATLLMGVKDWDRATNLLSKLVEQYPNHKTVYPDAVHLLGETYFKSKQYMSARRKYRQIVEASGDPRFARFRERAFVRLVDIAMRLRDTAPLAPLFVKMKSEGGSDALSYARGKGLYALGNDTAAQAALGLVGQDSEYAHQARYLRGVVEVRRATPPPPPPGQKAAPAPPARYRRAIAAFGDVTRLPAKTAEQRHVRDLAWLAIARLHYEGNAWRDAVRAYNQIPRSSEEFSTMLYELAWVYVRTGDTIKAQRALEVLSVSKPTGDDAANAALLRGDLMLRAGQFKKSLKAYEGVRASYETLRDRVEKFLKSTRDPGVYFDTLTADQLELFETRVKLPAQVLQWAREGEEGERAFAIIDDVAISRRLIKESNRMIEQLNAILGSPNRIRALPELKNGAEKGLGLLNSIAIGRLALAHGLDDTESNVSGALEAARARRKKLERRLKLIPVTTSDFVTRERQAKRQWNKASQSLQRLELEVDTLQATINGLEKILRDGSKHARRRTPAQTQQYQRALEQQKRLVAHYRKQIDQLRRMTEAGRIQVGFGDSRFVKDRATRLAFTKALWEEVQLSQQAGGDLAAYAGRVRPLLEFADKTDRRIEAALGKLNGTAAQRTAAIRKIVQAETQNIVRYSIRLQRLDTEARLVVGSVAMQNFMRVRDRLRAIVLRADVGITEEAWEVREEQINRVRRLRVERARTQRRLQRELDEVLDDSGEPEGEDE